jgi:hypothetical protein
MIRKPLHRAAAEDIAVKALTFLTEDEERLGHFMAVAGLSPDTLRAAARSPDFLAGILDYIVSEEALIVGFARQEALRPEEVMAARHVLSPVLE